MMYLILIYKCIIQKTTNNTVSDNSLWANKKFVWILLSLEVFFLYLINIILLTVCILYYMMIREIFLISISKTNKYILKKNKKYQKFYYIHL